MIRRWLIRRPIHALSPCIRMSTWTKTVLLALMGEILVEAVSKVSCSNNDGGQFHVV